jgi:hypothetical protein
MNITFNVKAFRELSNAETRQAVLAYIVGLPKKERPKRGQTLTLLTTIGSREQDLPAKNTERFD